MSIDIFSSKKKDSPACDPIKEELLKLKIQLDSAKSKFSEVSDIDLAESYIFEINALNARYRYLLRCAKESTIA